MTNIDVNEYGTPVSVHTCTACGTRFTVCPPAGPHFGNECLAEGCSSYDISRDIGLFWDVAQEQGWIHREET